MKTKKLTLLAVLMALNIAISSFFIPVGPNLRIYFTFLISMLVSSMYSYPTVFIYAAAEDILSFFIFPSGTFFFGYTLTAIASMTIYHIFLYKKVTLPRIAISKLLVNVLVNMLLGSLWSYILYSKGYMYYLAKSVVKNLIMCPIEVLLFWFVYRSISPLIHKYFDQEK